MSLYNTEVYKLFMFVKLWKSHCIAGPGYKTLLFIISASVTLSVSFVISYVLEEQKILYKIRLLRTFYD